jgi:hypothetical protein
LFEKNDYGSRIKGHEIKVDEALLSMLAASTALTYQDMFSDHFIKIGFINRLWVVAGEPDKSFAMPEEIPQERIIRVGMKARAIIEKYQERTAIPLDENALKRYQEWYVALREEKKDSEFVKRIDTYAMRFMLLFAASEGNDCITLDIVDRVIETAEWEKKVRARYDPIDAESLVAKLEGMIRKALLQGPLKPRDLKRTIHAHRYGLFFFDCAIKNLGSSGEVAIDEKKRIYLCA